MGKFRVTAILAAASVGFYAATGTSPAFARSADHQVYRLPAQPLAETLRAISVASGRAIVAPAELLSDTSGAAVEGAFKTRDAIAAALAGSGLRSRAVAGGFVIESDAQTEDQDVVVTGSRIRGGTVASPVITRTATDFRDQGKYDLGDAVRSIPQNFGGGQNPGVGINVPANSGFDVGGGSSINLRGLGSDATLTLLDGHRLAFSASSQSIDVSAIPLGAVERLDIVPDGASALYGSDAVAGVANIILRKRLDGALIGTRIAGATDGGDFQQQYWATAGTHWTGGSITGSYEYGSNSEIRSDQRSYAASKRPGLTLFPALRHHSAILVGEQALSDTLTFDIDALYHIHWSDTIFPTVANGDLKLGRAATALKDQSYAIAPSFKLALPGNWRISLSGVIGQERVDYAQTSCALAACSVTGRGFYRNTERAAELGGDGSLFTLPGGDARIAIGAGYRTIGFERFALNGATVNAKHVQDSYYAYGELDVPIIGPAQGLPMVDRITATGAVRYERYPGIGAVATPKFGVVYAPTPDFDIKGSWGQSFRAPTLYQQYQPRNVVVFPPTYAGGTGYPAGSAILLVIGGNPALKPERATTWSATLAFHPRALAGSRLEFSYFNVDYSNRIVAPISFLSQGLVNPIYADQITRAPSAAVQAAIIAGAGTFLNASGVPYNPANIIAIVDNGNVNAGHQTARGLDILAEYRSKVAQDQSLKVSLDVSYLDSARQISTTQPVIPLAGRIFSPPHWRGQGSIAWTAGDMTLASTINYAGGVLDARTVTPVAVEGLTSVDVSATYHIATGPAVLRGIDVSVSVANLFNAQPSVIATSSQTDTPYDSTNYSPVGRLISLSISKRI
ncbi:Outer membrane receptor for ferrienterochelin and colicins [Sphingomonas sp. NFR15]|nr:Outer membrane receptor for ferrienterochelin and colicins [Sphingomonas sp. NFR15]